MAWNDIEWYSDLNPNCTAKLTLKSSNGWSGNVVRYGYNVDISQRQFYFKIDGTESGTPWGTFRTYNDGNCRTGVLDVNDAIVGISLEHMGKYLNETYNYDVVQFRGKDFNDNYAAWGAMENDTALRLYSNCFSCDLITVVDENGGETDYNDINYDNLTWIPGDYLNNIECQKVYTSHFEVEIDTDLPIFETDADLLEYCQSGGTITNKIMNRAEEPTPEEEYDSARKYNYVKNIYGHNANNVTQYTGFRNYRFYGGNGKICFYRVEATTSSPYTVKLANYSTYTIKSAGIYDTDDDDYTTISDPELYFLHKSIQFADNNFYKKFKWQTDLLIFGSAAEAEQWERDEIDARQAENWNEVSRAYDLVVDPGYGNPDPGYDNGINGQSYVHGARLWVMSSSQLNNFFDDIFDPLHINDLLDGTKLFGSNEIGAIQGIAYYPIDINDVATVNGTDQAIKIGSYTCPTATGKYVWNNNKMINCGSVFIAPVYNDFRDYQIKLYASLPYCGFHELGPISKYMGKTLEVFYSVDITSGACSAHVLANGISYGDTFDGFIASQRPLTGLDQTAYLSSVMGCVSSIVNRESGMISQAKGAIAGVATGNAGQVAQGGSSFSGLSTSFGAISDLYGLSQAVKETPMSTRGGFAGCLGFFGNQQIHIVTAQPKTVKPAMEQQIVGYPSHVSQRIGNFSGYLKCSAINITNFSGTAQELADIQADLTKGIYL